MASSKSSIVFDDIFEIEEIDKDGKKFDRVSRLIGKSRNYSMVLTLDYNCEIFPLEVGQNVVLALASSLARDPAVSQDGTVEEDRDRDVWRPDGKGRRGFEDDYDYVMYGRVYRFDPGDDDEVTAYASFGGLLMSLTGSFRHMTNIVLGDPVFLLMRK
ncbi:hypothetical protein BGY98DRAFT_952452 [Russula aff. rugulosa BPL654]|nr:hypothetical protein BGY98DRAFT_952452 [Russula aff. rugulosa BPL654]